MSKKPKRNGVSDREATVLKGDFEEACNLLREFIDTWEEECQGNPYREGKFFDLVDDDFHALYDKVLGFLRSPRSRIPKPPPTKPPPCPL